MYKRILFSLVGAILFVYGLLTGSDAALYRRSLDININLIWGVVLLVFGGLMLLFAWRGWKTGAPPADAPKP